MCGFDEGCGFDPYFPADHRAWHRKWERGLAVPTRAWPGLRDGIVSVPQCGRAPEVNTAYHVGKLMQRENHYDRPPWDRFIRNPWWNDEWFLLHPHAFVALVERRAVGLLVLTIRPHCRARVLDSGKSIPLDELGPWPTVDAVFVCHGHRRRGLARALVRAAAQHQGLDPTLLAWYEPFTPAGRALATAHAVDGLLFVA